MTSSNSSISGIDEILTIAQNAGFSSLPPLQGEILSQIAGGGNFFVNTRDQRDNSLAILISVLFHLKQEPKSSALVITPEPEDVGRLGSLMDKLISHNKLRHISITLGPEREARRELKDLSRNPDIIIGNTGRIIDHIRKASLRLQEASIVAVFISQATIPSEFRQDLTYIFSKVPQKTTALFLSPEEKDLSLMKEVSRKPQQINFSQKKKEETSRMTKPKKESVPDEDSIKKTLAAILEEIKTGMDPHELDGYKKLLKKHVPLTMRSYVGAYFLRQAMKRRRMGGSSYRAFGAQGGGNGPRKGFVSLFFGAGKSHRIYSQDIARLVTTEAKISSGDVGSIRNLDGYSFVEIRESKADTVIKILNDSEFRNKKLTVNYARRQQP